MPLADDPVGCFAVVVPEEAVKAATRVPPRVRATLRIRLFAVDLEGEVVEILD
jgi:hypothetical protein